MNRRALFFAVTVGILCISCGVKLPGTDARADSEKHPMTKGAGLFPSQNPALAQFLPETFSANLVWKWCTSRAATRENEQLYPPSASGSDGDRVYTLKGADEPYLLMVQNMGEGALTVSPAGLILFANAP